MSDGVSGEVQQRSLIWQPAACSQAACERACSGGYWAQNGQNLDCKPWICACTSTASCPRAWRCSRAASEPACSGGWRINYPSLQHPGSCTWHASTGTGWPGTWRTCACCQTAHWTCACTSTASCPRAWRCSRAACERSLIWQPAACSQAACERACSGGYWAQNGQNLDCKPWICACTSTASCPRAWRCSRAASEPACSGGWRINYPSLQHPGSCTWHASTGTGWPGTWRTCACCQTAHWTCACTSTASCPRAWRCSRAACERSLIWQPAACSQAACERACSGGYWAQNGQNLDCKPWICACTSTASCPRAWRCSRAASEPACSGGWRINYPSLQHPGSCTWHASTATPWPGTWRTCACCQTARSTCACTSTASCPRASRCSLAACERA